MTAQLYTFPTARRTLGAPAPAHEDAPRIPTGERVHETSPGRGIASVTSLEDRREAGRRLADLQAAAARARRDGDYDRERFFQGAVDGIVSRAQARVREVIRYDDPYGGDAA